jgi:hypothetical protein
MACLSQFCQRVLCKREQAFLVKSITMLAIHWWYILCYTIMQYHLVLLAICKCRLQHHIRNLEARAILSNVFRPVCPSYCVFTKLTLELMSMNQWWQNLSISVATLSETLLPFGFISNFIVGYVKPGTALIYRYLSRSIIGSMRPFPTDIIKSLFIVTFHSSTQDSDK